MTQTVLFYTIKIHGNNDFRLNVERKSQRHTPPNCPVGYFKAYAYPFYEMLLMHSITGSIWDPYCAKFVLISKSLVCDYCLA